MLRPGRRLLTLALASCLALVASAPGRAESPGSGAAATHLDRAVQSWRDQGTGPDRQRVIVRLVHGERAAAVRGFRAGGLEVKAEYPLIDAATLEVPRAALDGLAHNPNIVSISSDAPIGAHVTIAPSGSTLRGALGIPGLTASGTPNGAGIGVAVIDSGISPSSVFGSRIAAFYDFTSGVGVAAPAADQYGHGTHVAGLIGGSGTPSGGAYPGIAPGVNLIGLKVLDANGQGYTSSVIAAIEFAVAQRARLGIDVINLSLGHPILEPAASDPLVAAVEAATRAGLVVVASAGNYGLAPAGDSGYAGITSPGNAPSAITVGSANINGTSARLDDEVAPYSSRGPTWYDGQAKPDVVAPGHALTAVANASSTLFQNYPSSRVIASADPINSYLRLSGTSMAAAVTSGVVALMMDAHRTSAAFNGTKLPPNAIKAALEFSATSLMDPATAQAYNALTQGTGEINAKGAVDLARAINASVRVGGYWMSSLPSPFLITGGGVSVWSQRLVWGSHLVWGSSTYFHELGWDAASPWGVLDATHLVWGSISPEHLVWGNTAIWGSHIVWGNALVGTVDGEHIVWGNLVDAAHIVWGNLTQSEHIVWGNAETVLSNSNDGTGELIVQEPEPPFEP